MSPIRLLAPMAAVLLVAACGKKDSNQDAGSAGNPGAADAANTTPPPAAPAPSGMMGAPAVAREGADSSNAAVQQRENEVNNLSQQAGGSGPGTATP